MCSGFHYGNVQRLLLNPRNPCDFPKRVQLCEKNEEIHILFLFNNNSQKTPGGATFDASVSFISKLTIYIHILVDKKVA